MSDFKSVSRSLIYSEFSSELSGKWFSRIDKKFISHIDTFYYVVYVDSGDWRTDKRKDKLIEYLSSCFSLAASSINSEVPCFENIFSGLTCNYNSHFNMYSSHFSLKDSFDVFISDYTPNKDTPPIFVQLRSNSLWLHGVQKTFDTSVDCIKKVLSFYGISISKISENRIDYASHTNYIQDLINYFPDKYLKDMQVSQFQRWHREGYFFDDSVKCDYFTLGRRKSNNVFFRIYDKTKEVIEMGYKQFFIPVWRENGLISLFDQYVLEHTFELGTWNAKERSRCMFYYEHGSDYSIRKEIGHLLDDPDTPFSTFKKIADNLVPDLTTVCNVEFQCKRKFFYNLRSSVPDLIVTDDYMSHIYNLLHQTNSIINHLTTNIIRFVKYKKRYSELPRSKRPDADWWVRLRSSRQLEFTDKFFVDYCFAYQNNLDLYRIKYNTLKSVAKQSAYYVTDPDQLNNRTYVDDFVDFYGSMNDNDIERFYSFKSSKFDEIKSTFMDVSEASEEQHKSKEEIAKVSAKRRYDSIFNYWISGCYSGRLLPDGFVSVLRRAFSSVPASRDVFCDMYNKFSDNSFLEFNYAASKLMDYCLKKIGDFNEDEL